MSNQTGILLRELTCANVFQYLYTYFFTLPITPNSVFLQVTEREHERMISELNAKHSEELSEMKAELRESLEAAHLAELQQLQVCCCIYLRT